MLRKNSAHRMMKKCEINQKMMNPINFKKFTIIQLVNFNKLKFQWKKISLKFLKNALLLIEV